MKSPLPLRYAAVIYGIALAIVLTIGAISVAVVRSLHARALINAENQAVRFVGGAQAALNRGVLSVDILLAGLSEIFPESDPLAARPENRRQNVRAIEAAVNQNLLVRHLALLSADGDVLISSDQRGNVKQLELPAEFLSQVLGAPIPISMMSEPTISPLSAQPVFYFGRFLQMGDGRGVAAVAEVEVSQLVGALTQGADIRGLEVTLERETGVLLASMPERPPDAARIALPVLGQVINDGPPARANARLTGAPAVVVGRPTLHRDIIVVASIPLSFALADWRRERTVIFVLAAAFVGITLAVAGFTHSRLIRQWRASGELLRSKATLDQALASMDVGFVLLDAEDRLLVWNRRFLEMFPWAQELTGALRPFRPILEVTSHYRRGGDEDQRATWLDAHRTLRASEQVEQELDLPGNRVIRATKNRTPDGGVVCIYQDITEKRMYTAEILESKAQLQATLDALPDMLLEIDLSGRCHRFHAPDTPWSAIAAADPVGRLLGELLPSEAQHQVMLAVRDAHITGLSKGRRFERRTADDVTWFEISVSRKSSGAREKPRFIVILRDTTQTEQATRRIEQLAFYDVLTGLPNRRLLLDRMAQAVRVDHDRHGALLFLDLDHFKTLNDALGHAMGDVLLKEAAARVSACVRSGDTVARLGGDEFVVMLEGLDSRRDEAQRQAGAIGVGILAALDRPFRLTPQVSHHSTCSIGVVLFDGAQKSLEDLLKQADIAMYYAKTSGGNTLRFFEQTMQTAIANRAVLETELHEALADQQFELHYQSQVTHLGEVTGAELLIRWRHPHKGLVLPGDFIEVAEETGLIVAMGLWVLETACRQLKAWSDIPGRRALQLAVNVSERQFRRDDFVAQLRRVLAETGAEPTRLKLELTESLLQSKVEETIEKMNALKSIGIRFSMDDFGTGYSSLSYMTQLPLDQVKIDKFFVGGIGRDPKVELIVQTIIGMAHNLEVEPIAEGVETEEQRRFLEQHGCVLYQGYLFSEPVPLAAFEALVDASRV